MNIRLALKIAVWAAAFAVAAIPVALGVGYVVAPPKWVARQVLTIDWKQMPPEAAFLKPGSVSVKVREFLMAGTNWMDCTLDAANSGIPASVGVPRDRFCDQVSIGIDVGGETGTVSTLSIRVACNNQQLSACVLSAYSAIWVKRLTGYQTLEGLGALFTESNHPEDSELARLGVPPDTAHLLSLASMASTKPITAQPPTNAYEVLGFLAISFALWCVLGLGAAVCGGVVGYLVHKPRPGSAPARTG